MEAADALVVELAGAVLDGTPVDWPAAASKADEDDRSLIEQLRVIAALADIHRDPPRSDAREERDHHASRFTDLSALRDLTGVLEALRTGVDTFRASVSADSPQVANGLFLLGNVLRLKGRPNEGLPYLEEAHAIWQKKPRATARDLADAADLDAALVAILAAVTRARS